MIFRLARTFVHVEVCLCVCVAFLVGAECRRVHRRQIAEQRKKLSDRDCLAARGSWPVNILIDGSQCDLLHGTMFGLRLPS